MFDSGIIWYDIKNNAKGPAYANQKNLDCRNAVDGRIVRC